MASDKNLVILGSGICETFLLRTARYPSYENITSQCQFGFIHVKGYIFGMTYVYMSDIGHSQVIYGRKEFL